MFIIEAPCMCGNFSDTCVKQGSLNELKWNGMGTRRITVIQIAWLITIMHQTDFTTSRLLSLLIYWIIYLSNLKSSYGAGGEEETPTTFPVLRTPPSSL
jgi:hypothetical protein